MGCLRVFVILFAYFCGSYSKITDYQGPQIKTRDGHLIISAYTDKNIKFQTTSEAAVMINDIDVLLVLQEAKQATLLVGNYQRSYLSVSNRLTSLEQRLTYMPGFSNGTNTDTSMQAMSIRRLSRRLTNLQRSVNVLRSLLVKDECVSSPCQNGGVCRDLFDNYICQCRDGWEGHDCSVDVNECGKFAGTDLGCQNGATCVNKPGTYECLCQAGYVGIHCTRKTADCATGGAELCGHGICIPQNTPLGYKCICDQGWTTDGRGRCTADVDECSQNRPGCSTHPRVSCINVPGSFFCGSCPQGYTGNGYYCEDINECEIANGYCSMNPKVLCINTPGSRICNSCPAGYYGDGVSCVYRGVCNVDNGGCHHMAQCRDNPRISPTYVECICPLGYVGSGEGPNGCVLSSNRFNPCASNPCNSGTCSVNNVTGDYVCNCRRRYTGRNCDILKDPCASNPCLNGGTCQSVVDLTFKCNCQKGFVGTRCESERQGCGGQLEGANGTLKYPPAEYEAYDNNLSCTWTIKTDSDFVLNITFKKFDLEKSTGCLYDWLQLHDGGNSAAHGLGRFCGDKLPLGGTIISTHNIFYLWFRSNGRTSKGGFTLTWHAQNPKCGGTMNVTSHGSLQSPGSPGMYPPDRDCYWTLTAPTDKRLLFHFYSLMIGENKDCNEDYVEFLTGFVNGRDVFFAKICNSTIPVPFYSPGPTAVVHFHSNVGSSHPGFQLTYSVAPGIPGCGGTYTSESGTIQFIRPSVDGYRNIICEFNILQHNNNTKLRITILSLDLAYSVGCTRNYLEVREGPNANSPLIGRFCNTVPPPITSLSNQITILSSTFRQNSGWKLQYQSICAHRFTAPSGEFNSPHKSKAECIYQIERPPGHRIELIFKTVAPFSCVFGFIELRDGDNENATLLDKYCTNSSKTIVSTHNALWIHYVQRDLPFYAKQRYLAFEATYTSMDTGCGGILRSKNGKIASPSHPEGYYPPNLRCSWVIIVPPGNVIQLSWVTFRVEQSYECSYDNVQVFDNNTELGKGELMGKFCGSTLPRTLQTLSNIMTIVFTTDVTIHMDGFLALYNSIPEQDVCGGNYYTSSGIMKSPKFPNDYTSNQECTWIITVRPNQQILLNVTDFDLEFYNNCRYDFLEIRNGGTSASPLIGKYCGKNIPRQIPSHANQLYLRFKSDMSKSARGFRITWSSTSTGCGGILSSASGSIISPQYPEMYSRNTECTWKITISPGSRVQMVFSDIDLEKQTNCLADYVQIFDGLETNTKSLGKFCSGGGSPILSTGNKVLVVFRSDVAVQGRGFRLHYTTMCNNTLTGFSGVIASPNFPNSFSQDDNCLWNIIVSDRNKINITFSHFFVGRMLNSNSSCPYDHVEIKYLENYSEMIESENSYITEGRYCYNNIPKLISINSDHAQIHLVPNRFGTGAGFRLEWQLFGCGGILTHNSGIIESPNYPWAYPPSIRCEWIIQVDFGSSIQILFNEVDIERDTACDFDAITIYNGPNNSSNLLTKLCDQKKPITLSSTGNVMYIEFKADYSYQGKGFHANYSTIAAKCGGHFTAIEGSILSPNYPQNYDRNDTCEWLIEIDENHSIELTFEDLDLLQSDNCERSYVKIHDGPTEAYPVLGKVCGNETPNASIHSTFNEMYIVFKGHSFVTAKGFLAIYRKTCGARISTQGSGIIQINQNEFTDHITSCIWTIVSVDPTLHVSLVITHIDVQYSYCEGDDTDQIQIFGGSSTSSPIIKSLCGSKVPPPIITDGSSITISLLTQMDFSATYSVLDSHCGGTYTSTEGYFATPGYPNQYASNIQCEWMIRASPGNHLTLSFIDFDIISSEKCNSDYLEIRRNNSSGKLLGFYCGTNKPENITNEGNLWMLYKTSKLDRDTSTLAKGFYGEYSLNHYNELTGSRGVIASPMYPDKYSNYGTFSWKITVANRKKVLLTFKEFYVETDPVDGCYLVSFEVYDGVDETAPLLKSLCGLSLPDPITSTSNIMYMQTVYNSFRMGSKFMVEWLEVSNGPANKSSAKVQGCGSSEVIDINARRNYTLVTSPGYPTGYAPDLNCEWIFSTIPMNHIKFHFSDIDLQNDHCHTDYISIYQKHSYENNWHLLNTVCNKDSVNEDIIAADLLKMKFVTNRYTNGTGFKAYVYDVCGGSMSGASGYILFDKSTPRSYECQWNVTVRSGRTINLSFLEMNIPKDRDNNCKSYIMVRNGKFSDSPLLGSGKYCGTRLPETLHSTGNHLYIKYRGSTLNVNFQLKYQEVPFACGGDITLTQFDTSTEITSPNYPNIPAPYSECIWLINAPPGESLRIDFVDRFDLSVSENCTIEYVELRDGGTEYSPFIGRYCKTTAPSTQFSTDNILFVKFFTDTDEPKNGFKANVSLAYCGGTLRGYSGKIKSPPIKNGGQNINCTWNIVGPLDHYLTLQFTNINIRSIVRCDLNGMVTVSETYTVFNPFRLPNQKERLLGQYCGTTAPSPFNTSSNEAKINFVGSNNDKFILLYNASETVCGGKLVQETGTIMSPGYPGMNHVSRECYWDIEVPQGRRVKLEILDIDLGLPIDTQSPGIVIYDGPKYLVPLAYLRAGSSKNIYESSSNLMIVRFWSVRNFYHRGFKASFSSNSPTVCEGDFNADRGFLTQPPVKNVSYWCQWTHNNKNMYFNQTLALTVTYNTNATVARQCHNAWFIHLKNQDDKIMITELCKISEKNRIVRTPFYSTKLEAAVGRRYEMNFTVSYEVHDCGGIIRKESGFISSPNFPNKPSKTVECAWLLKVDEEQTINLTASVINFDSDCQKNYLSIYNGDLPTHPRIGKYCHDNKFSLISQSNSMWIEYKWEMGSVGTGFKLKYEAMERGCGGIFHDRSRIIQSPNYGIEYPNNAECLWEIRSEVGYSIRVEFIDRFYLEDSQDCKNDYIEIWDWRYDKLVSLGKKCGRNTPEALQSTGDKLQIMFRTNKDVSATGFKAKWSWICGGTFEATKISRYVVSPGYPVAYPENIECIYNISTKSEENLNILFEDFDIEKGPIDCRYDNITIKGNYLSTYTPIGQTYCGTNSPKFIRLRGSAIITFKTDGIINRKGFKFMYKDESCGGEVTEEQVLEYEKPHTTNRAYYYYYSRIKCAWKISAPPKKVVVFKLLKLDVGGGTCGTQSLQIYNTLSEQYSNSLAALCGYITDSKYPIVAESGKMLVKIDINYLNFGAFKAEVYFSHGPAEGCGGFINLTETKTIQSPNLADVDCSWKIIAPRDYQIQIHFTKINIPVSCTRMNNASYTFCSCSYVEIRDGAGPTADLIRQICSSDNYAHGHASISWNLNATTTSNTGFIRFFLMGTANDVFKATLTPVLSKCGPSILNVTKEIQTLTTPNYPNQFPEGIRCAWAFEIKTREKVVLHFVDFDLYDEWPDKGSSNTCSGDKVEIIEDADRNIITNGLGPGAVFQGKRKTLYLLYNDYLTRPVFCGKTSSPFDYYSSGKSLTLVFESIRSQTKPGNNRGFKLEYSLAGCNRNFTSIQGRVSNGNDKSECLISITVPENRTISLYFLQLYIPYSPNCSKSVFEVRDGSSTGKELVRTCGYGLVNPVFSYTNKLYIHATFDGYTLPYMVLYDFLYTSTENGRGCGGEFYNYKGKFSSPLYPNQYRNYSVCTWNIRVPMGHQVALKFTNFDIQGSCDTTYVKVTTHSSDKTTEHTFCKDDKPAILRSDDVLEVEYSSSPHNGGIGWMAIFQGIQGDDVLDVS